jgi:hypothetical protein
MPLRGDHINRSPLQLVLLPGSGRVRRLSAFTAVAVALSTASAPSLETSTPSALPSIYRRLITALGYEDVELSAANMSGLALRNELLTLLAQ